MPRLRAAATAQVVSNDWRNGILHLDRSLTWTNGQGIALAYDGAAPDIGAYEFISDPGNLNPPMAPSDIRILP